MYTSVASSRSNQQVNRRTECIHSYRYSLSTRSAKPYQQFISYMRSWLWRRLKTELRIGGPCWAVDRTFHLDQVLVTLICMDE
jgi:hypothetical protein